MRGALTALILSVSPYGCVLDTQGENAGPTSDGGVVMDQASSCNDGWRNGNETDTDCGGDACPPCKLTKKCNFASDCESAICASKQCVGPGCVNHTPDGEETDTDCGGSQCGGCDTGMKCKAGTDCLSGVCDALVCAAPTCTDTHVNGNETDIDCGGGDCPKCPLQSRCEINDDCASNICDGHYCVGPESCTDTKHNQDETDIDCGGTTCTARCGENQACELDSDCTPLFCNANKRCEYPTSCADIQRRQVPVSSPTYQIKPDPAGQPVTVQCDFSVDGGGWTSFLHCVPSDGCQVSSPTVSPPLYNFDWSTADYTNADMSLSYALGKSLQPLVKPNGQFMLEITHVATSRTAYLIYPLTADTVPFFYGTQSHISDPVQTTIIDEDTAVTYRPMRVCSVNAGDYQRSFAGFQYLSVLGQVSDPPWAAIDPSSCSAGTWASQIYVTKTDVSANFGRTVPRTWGTEEYSHRIWVRDAPITSRTIKNTNNERTWDDGTVSRRCADYSSPTGGHTYAGDIGSGLYSIKPSPSSSAYAAYCDMDNEGGGWTMIMRTVWEWAGQSQTLMTGWDGFYLNNVGNMQPGSAARVRGMDWPLLLVGGEWMETGLLRAMTSGASCNPLHYKGAGISITASPGDKKISLSPSSFPFQFVSGPYAGNVPAEFATTDSGPTIGANNISEFCVKRLSAVPWFYNGCCSYCPTVGDATSGRPGWSQAVFDGFAPGAALGACTPNAPSWAGGFYELNAMEIYLR